MRLDNRTYDALKWVAQILLPGLGALYFGLGQIWGFPKIEEVIGSLTVLDVFIGGMLGLSSASYKQEAKAPSDTDGFLTQVGSDPETGMPHLSLTLNKTPDEVMEKDAIHIQIARP